MVQAESVFRKVLERITPTEKDRQETDSALSMIMKATDAVIGPLKLKKTLAGSYLRDTWLSDKKEFDIFIMFQPSVPREELERTGLDVGKKIVKALEGSYEIAYAEHPYVRAKVGKFAVDFVPCYDVDDPNKIQSAVDRTPYHNKYILKNLKPGMSQEVRLLKQFCKGIGVYGSDLRVEGFSGYLAELLTIRYGTMKNLVMDARGWEAGKAVIDLEGHHREKRTDMKSKFPGQALVVIDPVDRDRNVAAALSAANFELFRHSCTAFLKSPDESYFRAWSNVESKAQLLSTMKKRGTKIIAISLPKPKIVDDIIFPQLRKSVKRITGMLQEDDFRVMGSEAWSDDKRCVMLFELEVWELPAVRRITGPPVFAAMHADQFIKKYAGRCRLWVEGSTWLAEDSRASRTADECLAKGLKGDSRRLVNAGIASYIAEGISGGFEMMSGREAAALAGKDEGFALFLTKYFKKKIV